MLRTLPRQLMRSIMRHDFSSEWPAELTLAPVVFAEEFGEVEHHFFDKKIEVARAHLYDAAEAFKDVGRSCVFRVPNRPELHYTGYHHWQIDGNPQLEELVREREDVLWSASRRLLRSYDELVRRARGAGFGLTALDTDMLHPRLEQARRKRETTAQPKLRRDTRRQG